MQWRAKGHRCPATVGGTKVKMVEAPVKEEDSGSEESEFMNYSGEFELPGPGYLEGRRISAP